MNQSIAFCSTEDNTPDTKPTSGAFNLPPIPAKPVDETGSDPYAKGLVWLCAMVPVDDYVAVDKEKLVAHSGIPKSYISTLLAELSFRKALLRKQNGPSFIYQRTPLLNRISASVVKEATIKRFQGGGPVPESETNEKSEGKNPVAPAAMPPSQIEPLVIDKPTEPVCVPATSPVIVAPAANVAAAEPVEPVVDQPDSQADGDLKSELEVTKYGYLLNGEIVWCSDKPAMVKEVQALFSASYSSIELIKRVGLMINVPTLVIDDAA